MSEGIAGKIAVVTGAARGVGRATALRLARAGADVVISDLDLDGAKTWGETLTAATVMDEVKALGRRSIGVEGDLSDRAAANSLIERTVREMGRIDILVNNAGGVIAPVETSFATTTPDEDMELLFNANYRTMVNCSQAAAPHLRAQSGAIVNVTSGVGTVPPNGSIAHYVAFKGGVTLFTRSLAAELGPDGVRVNAVSPGTTLTARIVAQAERRGIGTPDQVQNIALRRFGQADDIAKVIEFLASDLAGFVTGQCIAVNGGASLSPV